MNNLKLSLIVACHQNKFLESYNIFVQVLLIVLSKKHD